MKGIIATLVLFVCSISVFAQNNFTITGILVDKSTGQPVDAATVSLLNAKDSSFVSGDMSSPKGVFTLKAPAKKNYLINVTFVGYQTLNKPVSMAGATTSTINVGRIELLPGDVVLQEAVVTGKAIEVAAKNDTIEYNAGSYKTEENAVVEDLLKKLPGVEVDKDGNITVNGKQVKRFLVNGKEFFNDDPKVASKNLPAQMIDKLQVLDKKSDMAQLTGFNDGDEETVINVTVKPGMKQGTMGNAAVGMGRDVNQDDDIRYETGAMLNHMRDDDRYTGIFNANNTNNMGASDLGGNRFGGMQGMRRGGSGGIRQSDNFMVNMNKVLSSKLSLNGDVSYNGMNQSTTTNTQSTTLNSQMDKTLTNTKDISDNFGARLRFDWHPDSSNTVIFRPNFQYNRSQSNQDKVFSRSNTSTQDTLFNGASASHNEGEGYNVGGVLEFSHKFGKNGRVLSGQLNASYNDSYTTGNSIWKERLFHDGAYDRDSLRNQRSENDYTMANFSMLLSYVEPLKHNNFLQLTYTVNPSKMQSINSTYNMFPDVLAQTDTAVLYGNQSRSTMYDALSQRVGFAFKSVRKKYNYTVGVNMDPSNSTNKTYQPYPDEITTQIYPDSYDHRLPNVKGDSLILPEITQNVINFSPTINFNYLFGQRTNLRIDYDGRTSQPTFTQLRPYVDESDPMNLTKGNPDLKPSYSNQLRAQFNKFVPESQLFYNFRLIGDLSFNDISPVTYFNDDGSRLTTYENLNGNWDVNLMGGFNVPLKNKKFSINSFIRSMYMNKKSYLNEEITLQKTITASDRSGISYRCSLFDLEAHGSIAYNHVAYNVSNVDNLETYDWGVGGSTAWYLPHKFTFTSEVDWVKRAGYAQGFNISQVLWNADISKQLFQKKMGTGTLKLKIYDILQQRSSVTGGAVTNGTSYTISNVIPSFFMCSFIYKFSIFPKGSSATEQDVRGGGNRWGGPGGGGPGGGGGRPF